MTRTLTLTILGLCIALCAAFPIVSYAQGGFVPLTKDASFDKIFKTTSGSGTNLTDFVNGAFRAALSLGAILAVLRIAWAGYQYMTSDAWGEKSHAKEILGDVVIGMLLLLSIWLILTQINPQLLKLEPFNLKPYIPNRDGVVTTSSAPSTPLTPTNVTPDVNNPGSCIYYDAMGVGTPTTCP